MNSPAVAPASPVKPGDTNFTYGPKCLLLGAGGAGKSHSLRTPLEIPGVEVAAIFTEASGMETLEDTPKDRFHWVYIPPAAPDWNMLKDAATKINQLSFKSLAELSDIDKRKFGQWMEYVSVHANYKCQRCGKELGPVHQFAPNIVLAEDSLSGMNEMAMNLVAGLKPVKSMSDWGVAMSNMEKFITTLTTAVPGMVILTAHLERETDEISGGVQLMASTLGRKLAPKISRFFSDVVMTRREGVKFEWSTAAFNVDLKTRNLAISDHIPPSFAPILQRWYGRLGYKPG